MSSCIPKALNNVLALIIVLGGVSLPAQEFRATLTGTITDPSSASVANAQVQAVNRDTKQAYNSVTTGAGVYFLPYVLPGTYTVTVTAPGFQTKIQENVLLQASESRQVNFALQVGSASQSVTVSDAPPLLEAANASGNTILGGTEVNTVPLNGRQIYMLLGTTPGSQFTVTTFGPSGNSGTRGWDITNAYRIGGAPQGYQQFTLNGANISLQGNGNMGEWVLAPNVDAVQEANVMTTTYDARYGRTLSGTVDTVIKSGSNSFHGTAYDYLENGDLNANNFENNLAGIARQNTHQNQYGGTFGGPVIKDKVFFFGSFEGYKESIPLTVLETVPTTYMRPTSGQGVNFTQSGYTIFDPTTTVCNSAGGTIGNCPGNNYGRSEFPGDTIPASRINPIGLALLNEFPLSNTSGNALQNNYIANTPDKYAYSQPMVRLDYDTSDKTRWYSLFAFQHGLEQRDNNGIEGVGADGAIQHTRQDLTASQDITHIFSPTFLADFKVSFTRFLDFENLGDFAAAVNPATIGLNMPNITTTTLKDLPQIAYSQLYLSGSALTGSRVRNNVYNNLYFDNDYTKTISSHTIHFGGEIGEIQYADPLSVGYANGTFEFETNNTQYNPLKRGVLSGINDGFPIADQLLGDPLVGEVDDNRTIFEGYPIYSIYAQDDWKVSRKLTVNLGIRYDVERGVRERYNQLDRGLCTTCVNPLSSEINYPAVNAALAPYGVSLPNPLLGGIQFAGVNGNSRDGYNTDWSNVGPRLGFAYAATPKTVIRGGWGLFYGVGGQIGSQTGFSQSTYYVGSNNGYVTPTNYFASGTPFPNGIVTPTGSNLGLLTSVGGSTSGTAGSALALDSPNRRIPRAQNVSFGIQQELPSQMVLEARYSGNFSSRLPISETYYNGTLSLSTLQQAVANPSLFNQQVPNPFYGLASIPGASYLGTNKTLSRLTLLTSLSEFGGSVGETNQSLGTANYNALEVKLNKRVTNGLQFRVSYTYSKSMQALEYENTYPYQNPNLLYEISPTDRTHVFAVTGEYNLPIGKGSKYVASNAGGLLGAFINGWTLSWVFTAQTGFPVALDNTGYYYNCAHSYTPDGGPTRSQYIYNGNGNPASCWSTIPQYGLATLPQQISTLRDPSVPNLDLSLQKSFAIRESTRLQFRADAFNITNSVLFGAPDDNPSDKLTTSNGNATGFGTVAPTQINFPRIVQLSLKLFF